MNIPRSEQSPLRFYFDFISPYAYLSWPRVRALAAEHRAPLEPMPVLFAALLNTHGQKGPAEIPSKRMHTFKHVTRMAHDLGVPLRTPPAHPFNPLLALRVASLPMEPPLREAVITALFDATWAHGTGIETPEQVGGVLEKLGLDARGLLAQAGLEDAKTRVREQTEAAIAEGVFGVPTVTVRGEVFWGNDSLPHVTQFLEGRDPVTPEMIALWSDLPASAVRPDPRTPR